MSGTGKRLTIVGSEDGLPDWYRSIRIELAALERRQASSLDLYVTFLEWVRSVLASDLGHTVSSALLRGGDELLALAHRDPAEAIRSLGVREAMLVKSCGPSMAVELCKALRRQSYLRTVQESERRARAATIVSPLLRFFLRCAGFSKKDIEVLAMRRQALALEKSVMIAAIRN